LYAHSPSSIIVRPGGHPYPPSHLTHKQSSPLQGDSRSTSTSRPKSVNRSAKEAGDRKEDSGSRRDHLLIGVAENGGDVPTSPALSADSGGEVTPFLREPLRGRTGYEADQVADSALDLRSLRK